MNYLPKRRIYAVLEAMVRWLGVLGGIAATSVLLALALPLGEQAYLAWFCLTPLLIATRDRGFLVGCLCSLACLGLTALLLIWGPFDAHPDPRGDPNMVLAGFAQFGVSIGAVTAIWSDATLNRKPAWWFASLATLCEAALLLTLPANLALTQYRQPVPLMLASLGGIWLVSFLLYWSNFALALMRPRAAIALAAGLAVFTFGASKLDIRASGPTQRFATIQLGDVGVDSLTKMQKQASRSKPALVVWPELSGVAFVRAGDTSSLCKLSAGPGNAPFITTFEDDCRPLQHNVSSVFAGGRQSAWYAKRKMFGGEGQIHQAGDRAVAVDYPGGRVGLAVCYDSCFPETLRDTARLGGVNVITLPSFDPYASNHFIAAMHAAYSPFRCAEEGVAMVRDDGHAYSQIVDPFGDIVAELPPGDGILVGDVPTATHWTVFKALGDWWLLVCGGLFGYGWWRLRLRNSGDSGSDDHPVASEPTQITKVSPPSPLL